MSLDVYLKTDITEHTCTECGGTGIINKNNEVFFANITHNLNKMADEAGIYMHLWRPEELAITKAKELIEPLHKGVALMRSDKARFEKFDSPNGWGTYDDFVPWVEKYLEACENNPEAIIGVSR